MKFNDEQLNLIQIVLQELRNLVGITRAKNKKAEMENCENIHRPPKTK